MKHLMCQERSISGCPIWEHEVPRQAHGGPRHVASGRRPTHRPAALGCLSPALCWTLWTSGSIWAFFSFFDLVLLLFPPPPQDLKIRSSFTATTFPLCFSRRQDSLTNWSDRVREMGSATSRPTLCHPAEAKAEDRLCPEAGMSHFPLRLWACPQSLTPPCPRRPPVTGNPL